MGLKRVRSAYGGNVTHGPDIREDGVRMNLVSSDAKGSDAGIAIIAKAAPRWLESGRARRGLRKDWGRGC
jgi:hypothetical protein